MVYSTSEQNDEVLNDIEFAAWSKRFLRKKKTSVAIARVILNSK